MKIGIYIENHNQSNSGGIGANSPLSILDVLTNFLATPSSISTVHGGITAGQLNTTAGTATLGSKLTDKTNESDATPTIPKAYINYLFFDEQFKCVGAAVAKWVQ